MNSPSGEGGGFVPTSEVDLTPPEGLQSSRPGTGTEGGLGLGWLITLVSIICKMEQLVVNESVPTKTTNINTATLLYKFSSQNMRSPVEK